MTYGEWLKLADEHALEQYGIDAVEIVGSDERLRKAFERCENPVAMIEARAEAFDLDRIDDWTPKKASKTLGRCHSPALEQWRKEHC